MIRNIYKKLFKLNLFLILNFVIIFSCQAAFAQIGIISSNTSAKVYSNRHIGNYSELFQEIVYTFSNTNIKYNIISENELDTISVRNFSIIVLPLITDLSPETYSKIESYIQEGGKIIVIFPDTYSSPMVQRLAELVGVQLGSTQRTTYKTTINWLNNYKIPENYFPVSTRIATIFSDPSSKPIASWNQNNETSPAITISNKGSYISWRWGNDGTLSFNVAAIKSTIESLVPGIIIKEQSKLAFKEMEDKISEINKLRQDTSEFLESFKQASSTTLADIQEHVYISKMQENLAKSYYQNCEYEKAQEELKKARINAMYAYAKVVPSNVVEGRTLWLDRGTIVAIKNPKEMSDLFNKIQKIGINIVYFETLNAGYAIYPSEITEQNPQTKGWDPLYWAVQEAHKRNIELHAWAWIFAVGNTRHNPIIGKPNDYPGPIIAKNPDLALLGPTGNMIPANQHEYWIDPANIKARKLIISILEEMATDYQIDGIQLDYIRYPFQTVNNYMGYNPEGKQKFEIESGYKLDKPDETIIKAWNIWKTKQVTKFVQEASYRLKKIKPDIQISAAVFGTERSSRMSSIQQDWENWVDKGWVDILNPMIYSSNTPKLVESINYINKAIGYKAFVYPGIAVRQLGADDLLDQIYAIKGNGLMGSTIFAMAHLDPDKSELLEIGPYRFKEAKAPNSNPVNSARILVEEFLYNVNSLKQDDSSLIAIRKYTGNAVIAEAGKTHAYILKLLNNPTPTNIQQAIVMLRELENLTQRWLMVDSSIKPTKLKLLTTYLKEAQILLSYEHHKQSSKDYPPTDSVIDNMLSKIDKN
ncbi:MAG: hypothetical protein A2255_10860 [Candidatus Melainabacteria bacterium RIFOXYA2_FULL_32_9]|nr:MAG: hypothetical protein A2255_10860 [Candidatus Melainabacteria bacterium RIFOXYA2_FULL_32_9]